MQSLSPLMSLTRGKRLLGGLSLVLPCWLGVLAGPLVAQDVVVGEPEWAARGGPLEKIPSVTERLRVMYPAEMRKTDEIGYVFQRRVFGPEGATRVLRIEGNLHPFSREVAEATREMRFSVRPGELPSEVARGVAIVFNPKSASTTGPDATARLISPALVRSTDPKRKNQEPQSVRAVLAIDAAGVATLVSAPAGEAEDIRRSLPQWRFAPARRGGQAVASQVEMSILWESASDVYGANVTLPKVTQQDPPTYPPAMRVYGMTGTVVIDFRVTPEGRVENAVIEESNNPGFDLEAVETVLKWRFAPATLNGKPITARMRVPMIFQIEGSPSGGMFSWSRPKGDQSDLPEKFRYDTPAAIRSVSLPVYPYEALRDKAKGKARVVYVVDQTGQVIESKVASADRPEFGEALRAAVHTFRFDPALNKGKPGLFLAAFEHTFSPSKMDVGEEMDLLILEKKSPEKIVSAGKLDTKLRPISQRAPDFPPSLQATQPKGSATVEFLVDKRGRVRLPRVVEASAPEFGYAAVQAISTWLFEPPVAKGKPTVVRVQVPVEFSLKS